MTSRAVRWFWVLVLALLLVGMLTLGLKDFARESILIPLGRAYAFFRILQESLPQSILWAGLLTAVLFLALRGLSPTGGLGRRLPGSETRFPRRDRIGFWEVQLKLIRGGYSTLRFSEFFGKLVLEVLAFQEQLSPAELERRLSSRQIQVPPELQSLLEGRQRPLPRRSIRLGWRPRGHAPQPTTFERDLERLVEFLEGRMKIQPLQSASGTSIAHPPDSNAGPSSSS